MIRGYSTGDFDHKLFWDTMRKWSKNNYVFISEETAPSDFKSVWSKSKTRTLNKKVRFAKKERLFVFKGTHTKTRKYRRKHKVKNHKTRKV